jgi:hypothetical protein
MVRESRHISERIDRPADEVYDYAADPANLPEWAAGLGSVVEQVDGQWFVRMPTGRAALTFVPRNDYGVLDHFLTLPSGETFHNPMRAIADGDGCEVVFTVRRQADMTDEEFERDVAAVAADLAALKRVLEAR